MKVLNEMIEFVNSNFEANKDKFSSDEKEMLNELDDNFFFDEEDNYLLHALNSGLDSAQDSISLIELINERSLGVDLEDDSDAINLFNMIKAIKEAAN
jgi:hypothetical protein